jgi:chromate transporter
MNDTYWQLFLRFLRFGLLAWGGPVAQIAMLRQELVEEEQWISPERFNRVLAVYQVLPGPEATELCVYFGMIARGRLGGFLAGFAFFLPGFLAMFALSWLYVRYGLASPLVAGLFYGFKPAVAALIIRAIHRIGAHALTNRWLWAIALAAGVAAWLGVHFLLILIPAGLLYTLVKRQWPAEAAHALFLLPLPGLMGLAGQAVLAAPSLLALFGYGLRTGLLTFGGAYTAIPFLQHDAVEVGQWMSNTQFLDGLALSGILPAPLIIFSTFVGYVGGGPLGALVLTAGVFMPAFAFTLVGHEYVERLVENTAAHAFLDGVTAGVVGLIAATSLTLLAAAIPDWQAGVIFALALFLLYVWKAKAAVAAIVLGAGLIGMVVMVLQ